MRAEFPEVTVYGSTGMVSTYSLIRFSRDGPGIDVYDILMRKMIFMSYIKK